MKQNHLKHLLVGVIIVGTCAFNVCYSADDDLDPDEAQNYTSAPFAESIAGASGGASTAVAGASAAASTPVPVAVTP